MARSDLLLSLVHGANRQDQTLVQRSVAAMIAEERAKQHHVLADRLEEVMRKADVRHATNAPRLGDAPGGVVHERVPQATLERLILPRPVLDACQELVTEHQRVDLLRSYGLEPRHRVLLVGPPGNGKTSLAEALAASLMVPLFAVRYEGVIGSYLGETAARLNSVFEYARTRHCVLFFDEFDTVGKERGDAHETGEIKRVVSSLLMQIDQLPTHVIVVTATNHPELLDRAVWRRFQLRLVLPAPSLAEITTWIGRFEESFGHSLGVTANVLASRLRITSFAELDEFGQDVRRQYVLSLPGANLKRIVAARVKQWASRFQLDAGAPSKATRPRA